MLLTRSPVDHGHRPASWVWHDTSLVVSGSVDCGRRRRNVYDQKHQRYAKHHRTAHLTARSDKYVAYVINNKWLKVCTVEANYWQTRSIARSLCDSRATCSTYCPNSCKHLSHHTPVWPHEAIDRCDRCIGRQNNTATRLFLISNTFSTMSKLFTPSVLLVL